jgi:hypothetical protein
MSQLRRCPRCNTEKLLDTDYYKNKNRKNGYQSYCIPCVKASAYTYNRTPEGRKKLSDIQSRRYKTMKEEGTYPKYYKPVPEDQKKKTGRKPIPPEELERREKQKQYEKEIKNCNTLVSKINNMMIDTESLISELDAKVKYINDRF